MTKPKTLEQLRAEKERAETQLLQEQHKLERLEKRKKFLEQGERKKRTHRLCNLGGTVESLAPEVKDLTRTEMTELMEHIFSLSEVQRAVRHMAITHISQVDIAYTEGNRIAEAIEKYHAKLLILDPMSSYIGEDCSMNKANETRAEFNHLSNAGTA